MKKITTSKLFSINWLDVSKALLLAIITPILALLYNRFTQGDFNIHWQTLVKEGIIGGVAYLLKNFCTPSKTLVNETPPKNEV